MTENITEVDTAELEGNVEDVLRDTDIPELQPEYLQGELDAVREDIVEAGRQAIAEPRTIRPNHIGSRCDTMRTERAETIEQSVCEDAIAEAVAQNTELSEAEAQEATQNIVDSLNTANNRSTYANRKRTTTREETQQELSTQIEELRVQTEQANKTASKASIWSFVAIMLTMILTSIGGSSVRVQHVVMRRVNRLNTKNLLTRHLSQEIFLCQTRRTAIASRIRCNAARDASPRRIITTVNKRVNQTEFRRCARRAPRAELGFLRHGIEGHVREFR